MVAEEQYKYSFDAVFQLSCTQFKENELQCYLLINHDKATNAVKVKSVWHQINCNSYAFYKAKANQSWLTLHENSKFSNFFFSPCRQV